MPNEKFILPGGQVVGTGASINSVHQIRGDCYVAEHTGELFLVTARKTASQAWAALSAIAENDPIELTKAGWRVLRCRIEPIAVDARYKRVEPGGPGTTAAAPTRRPAAGHPGPP